MFRDVSSKLALRLIWERLGLEAIASRLEANPSLDLDFVGSFRRPVQVERALRRAPEGVGCASRDGGRRGSIARVAWVDHELFTEEKGEIPVRTMFRRWVKRPKTYGTKITVLSLSSHEILHASESSISLQVKHRRPSDMGKS